MTITWAPNSKGQTKVEYNDEFPSPNRADALLMTYAPVLTTDEFNYTAVGMTSEATW